MDPRPGPGCHPRGRHRRYDARLHLVGSTPGRDRALDSLLPGLLGVGPTDVAHEFCQGHVQAVREPPGRGDPNFTLCTLDEADHRPVQAGILSKLLLSEAVLNAELTDPLAEGANPDPVALMPTALHHFCNLLRFRSAVDYASVASPLRNNLARAAPLALDPSASNYCPTYPTKERWLQMAIAKCRECDNNVSTEAQTCPRCGAPQPTTPSPPVPATGLTGDGTAESHARFRRRLTLVAGGVVALLGLLFVYTGARPDNGASSSTSGSTSAVVVYEVDGTALSVQLTTGDGSGTVEQEYGRRLPLTRSYRMNSGDFAQVTAQNTGAFGSVTCRVVVDGQVIATDTADGAYMTATCDVVVPDRARGTR